VEAHLFVRFGTVFESAPDGARSVSLLEGGGLSTNMPYRPELDDQGKIAPHRGLKLLRRDARLAERLLAAHSDSSKKRVLELFFSSRNNPMVLAGRSK